MDALAVPFLLVVAPFAFCALVLGGYCAWWVASDFVRRAWR